METRLQHLATHQTTAKGLWRYNGTQWLSRFLRCGGSSIPVGPAGHLLRRHSGTTRSSQCEQWQSHQQNMRQDVPAGFAPRPDWVRAASGLRQPLPYSPPVGPYLPLCQLPDRHLRTSCVWTTRLDNCCNHVQQHHELPFAAYTELGANGHTYQIAGG